MYLLIIYTKTLTVILRLLKTVRSTEGTLFSATINGEEVIVDLIWVTCRAFYGQNKIYVIFRWSMTSHKKMEEAWPGLHITNKKL